MLKKFLKSQRGLTLIELLAVIVILGIIAAIAVPSIGGIIKNTENDATVSEGISIINGAKLFMTTSKFAADSGQAYMTLDQTKLATYNDNVKANSYSVRVTRDTTTGKYSYSLLGHPAVALANKTSGATSATETQLLEASK